jgi:putative DNA primase/helicase
MLQEWMGLQLVPDTSFQKIAGLIGPRRSGKGTIVRILKAMAGPDNVAGPTLGGLGTNFGLAPLIGKQVAIISDARLSGRTDQAVIVERLLSISGEDTLDIDRKYLPVWTGKLPIRFTFLSNEMPRLSDSSGALTGRFLVFRFTRSFYGQEDRGLTDLLLTELPGIALWAIEGWRRLCERGHFIQPPSGREMVENMEDLASPVGAFVREACEVGPGFSVTVDVLFECWKDWCKKQGRDQHGTKQTFGRDLSAAMPEITMTRPRDGDNRIRYYEGIKVSPTYIWTIAAPASGVDAA